ncbi:MAG: serine--tRNA ligase [Actinobacteria bacterium]|nr:serine--tRNA ligase [Actinomycetota bacterium]
MLDIRLLRENPDLVRASQAARSEDVSMVDRLLEADSVRRVAATAFDTARAAQKDLGKSIGPLQGKVKSGKAEAGDEAQLADLMSKASALAEQVTAAEEAQRVADAEFSTLLALVPNLVDTAAPVGGEDDFATVETVGTPRDFTVEGAPVRDHLELGALLKAIDVERGAKVSGSRFYYLTGVGAELEFALVNLAMSMARANGFTPVIPPTLVRAEAMEGTGFLGQAAENVYHLKDDDMYLVGTAEVPLAAYHMDEILDPNSLPLRYAGFSPCFRREAGSHGKDTRGIIRVHWFDKVEMFSFTRVEDAAAEHERFLQWEKDFFSALEVPFRVIDTATGDLGLSAARKFDIEAWIPSQGTYREVTSTSNCTDFQARRLRIRTRDASGATTPVATINGTLVAVPRAIVALLENHQQSDGSVRVPTALQPFLGGRRTFEPVA